MSAYSLLDSDYGPSNYTVCLGTLLINPTHVDRAFDVAESTYKLTLRGEVPGITYPPVESVANETATFEIGFWPITHEEQFSCENCVKHGPLLFEKIIMDSTPVVCIEAAPIGYQNHAWRQVFRYVPIAIATLAAIVSLLSNIQTTIRDDLFLALSNYALDWKTLRLKESTAANVIFYAQYIFATGALNLQYPKFYPYFTSNFAWSWLLFSPSWMTRLLEHAFRNDNGSSHQTSQTTTPTTTTTKSKGVSSSAGTSATAFGTIRPVDKDVAISANIVELAMFLGIDLRGLFLASLVFFSFFVVGLALASAIFWLLWEILVIVDPYKFGGQRTKLASTCIGFYIRLLTLFYMPLAALSFYQLMRPGPWYLTTLASLLLVFVIFGLFSHISFKIIKARPQENAPFTDLHLLLRYGCLYSTLQHKRFYFFMILLVYKVLVGGMVGLFQMSGAAQATVMLALECGILIFHSIHAPYADKITQFVASLMAIIRTLISALNMAYIDVFKTSVTDRQRQYIAYTQICLHFLTFSVFLGIHLTRLLMLLTEFRQRYRMHKEQEHEEEEETACDHHHSRCHHDHTSHYQQHALRHHRHQRQRLDHYQYEEEQNNETDPYGLSPSSSFPFDTRHYQNQGRHFSSSSASTPSPSSS